MKFYERGSRPLEIVTSRQWYFRNGGREPALRDAFLARGRELRWHPGHMRQRYESWVEGLNTDWLISRQRFFGVPFPVWYRLRPDGEVDYDTPLLPNEGQLPIDPSSDVPDGFAADQRGKPEGFIGDPDVMDTWATSSLTPQIATGWGDDDDLFARTFPMDLRPQGPEIIRTWLFDTVVRAHFEHDSLPWTDTTINGWILDPDRKKMSKSKGNVVTPMPLLEQHGADAVRYWAANGRPGTDTAMDEGQMKVGRRLAIKLLNASKFALGVIGDAGSDEPVTEPLDRSMLAALADLVRDVTAAFEEYDYAAALERTERFFWGFCDDYLELVKQRAYGTIGESWRGLGACGTRDRTGRVAAAVRAIPLLRDRGGLVVVAGRQRAPPVVAAGRRLARARGRCRGPGLRRRRRSPRRGAQGEVRSAPFDARGGHERHRHATRRNGSRHSERIVADVRGAGSIAALHTAAGDTFAVDCRACRRTRGVNLTEALAWLTAHVNLETGIGVPVGVDRRKVAPTLERIRALTELLGSPQLEFPAVHLTGTNGKTSATRMVAALLDAVGLSTGSYTSPDLARVNERMALRGEPIDDTSSPPP